MSMLVCVVVQTAVYLAADSRQYPSGADTVQKAFLVGKDAMVGHGGIGVIPYDDSSGGAWDAAKEVGRVAASTPAGTFGDQLQFIQREVLESLNAGLLRYSGEITADNPNLTIMFVKRDALNQGYCSIVAFTIVSTPSGKNKWNHRANPPPPRPAHTSGLWWDVPKECPVGSRRPAALTRAAISAFVDEVGGQDRHCQQLIGGPIRVAISDGKGARWM